MPRKHWTICVAACISLDSVRELLHERSGSGLYFQRVRPACRDTVGFCPCGFMSGSQLFRCRPMWPLRTIQYDTIQYNTLPYNTVQYNTIQYNAIQYKIRTVLKTGKALDDLCGGLHLSLSLSLSLPGNYCTNVSGSGLYSQRVRRACYDH